ncbi:hypothetical protein MKW92_004822 [Papaver armeniacum]|nr:hypothetical protein MKW92_004822 [Papaver armeniacum]
MCMGYQMNMQPSEAEAGFDIRRLPTVDPELSIKRIVDEWAPHYRNMAYELNRCYLFLLAATLPASDGEMDLLGSLSDALAIVPHNI